MPGVRGNNDSSRSKELAISRASKALVRGDVYLPRHRRPAPQATPASGADLRAQAAAAPAATPVSRKAYPAPPVHSESQRADIARKVQDQTPRVVKGDEQRMKTLGEKLGATSGSYPSNRPDEEGKERAGRRAAESHNLNLHVSNDNVAIHASNYLDGQTGMRQRAMPYVRSFFSKKAAEELRVGKEIGKELEPIKTQIDESSPEARAAAIQAKRGQNASSTARAARGAGRIGAAATVVATGNPVAAAAVATAAGVAETGARAAAAKSHHQAAESYEVARQNPDLPPHLRQAAAGEGELQRLLASRAQRQAQKAAATTMFAATPGAMYVATGAEQTLTGAAAEAVREHLQGTSRRAEYATRIGEVVVGEAETRGVEKTVNSISARIKKAIGGVSRPEMQAVRVSRTRALQEAKRKALPPESPRPASSQPKAPPPEKVHSV